MRDTRVRLATCKMKPIDREEVARRCEAAIREHEKKPAPTSEPPTAP